jgi:ABC-type sugar transport system substrate-binding protein
MKKRRLPSTLLGFGLVLALAAPAVAADAPKGKMTVGIAGAQYESLAAGLIERGIAVKFLDARLDINKQVSELDQFVDEGVTAIVVNVAGDPNAVLGPLQKAEKAGIKIFSIGAVPGFDKVLIEADLPSEELGEKSGDYICKETGGTGEIALIEAIDIPVLAARWNSFLATIKKECPGLKVAAIERAVPDDAATARPIAENLLTRFPDLKAIWAMGDGPALGAGLAVQASGRKVIVTGLNGESLGINGVKQGAVAATWDMLPTEIGSQLAKKIADVLTGAAPVPTKTEVFTVHDLPMWTAANAATWKAYDARVKYPGLQ